MRSNVNVRVLACLALLGAMMLISASPALGVDAHWQATGPDMLWSTAANWSDPTSGANVYIWEDRGSPIILNSADSINQLCMAPWGGANYRTLSVTAGADLTVAAATLIGAAGNASVTMDGGVFNANVLSLGYGGIGVVNQSGGTFNTNTFNLADLNGAAGSSYNISGGVLNVGKDGTKAIGVRGAATMTVSGTAVVTIDGHSGGLLGLDIGGHLSGGVPLPDSVGTSSLVQTGGTVNLLSDLPCLRLGVCENTTGIYDLQGGVLNLATSVENWGGAGYLKVNGGALNFTGTGIYVDYFEVGTLGGSVGQFALEDGETLAAVLVTLGAGAGVGTLDILGGTALTNDLVFGSAGSLLRLGDDQSFLVLQSNYSEADALADIASGYVTAYNAGSVVGVSTVEYAGNLYTQMSASVIPEPSTIIMLSAGLLGLLAYAWRKRK